MGTKRFAEEAEGGTDASLRVGFVGAGVMAKGMVANLLKVGHRVRIHNRTRAHAEPLIALGATWAESPAAAADGADIAVSCVTDGAAVRHVALGRSGVREAAQPPGVYVDMSTISPAQARDIAESLIGDGIAMIDAPVTGGDQGSRDGTLTIFAGGDPGSIGRARPVFAAVGTTVHVMGGIGQGQAMKLIQNLVGGLNLLAAVEGANLAQAYGLDPAEVLSMFSATTSQSRMAEMLADRVRSGDDRPGFSVANRLKDFYLALDMARAVAVPSPLAAVGAELMAEAQALGWGRRDQTTVRDARTRGAGYDPQTRSPGTGSGVST